MSPLEASIAAELAEPVDARVSAMAAAIAATHGQASRTVLFYGSCLRESQLDGLMLDFYLIVSDYRAAYVKSWLATANRLIPPNVFPFAHDGLAAKYAVLSEDDFARLNELDASTVSVWARFAQPVRMVWHTDEAAARKAVAAIASAPVTLHALARPMTNSTAPDAVWREGFALTYQCELRAERTNRSGSIVDSDPDRYARISALLPPSTGAGLDRSAAERRWARLRRNGKVASVLRLAKASLTFAGGIDYLAWKINRHAGTAIEIKPWQRRWPILAAFTLLPRLFRSGAIR
ncbi:MAG: hypothetical protein RL481_1684 [Pseudomonadota bacterium]